MTNLQPPGGGYYPADTYDAMLQQLRENWAPEKLKAGMLAWQEYGTCLNYYFPSADYPANSDLAPASVGDLVQKYLANWQGNAADVFRGEVALIQQFATQLGPKMYSPAGENPVDVYAGYYPASHGTFNACLNDAKSGLETALFIVDKVVVPERKDFNTKLGKNIADFSEQQSVTTQMTTSGASTQSTNFSFSDIADGLPSNWGGFAQWYYSWERGSENQDREETNMKAWDVTLTFHFIQVTDDGTTEFASVTVPGLRQEWSNGSTLMRPMPTKGTYDDLATDTTNQLAGVLTLRYRERVTAALRQLVGPGGVFHVVNQNLPADADESKLPKKATGGTPPGGPGAGSPTLPGPPAGAGPLSNGPGGTGPLGTGPGGTGPGGTGPGGTGPGGGAGPVPTHLAGGGSGGPVAGLGGGIGGGGIGGGGSLGTPGSGLGGPMAGTTANGAGAAGTAGGLSGSAGAAGRGFPMMPPMMPPGAQGGEKDRPRKSWLPEEDDLWGTNSAVVPTVISNDP